MIKQAFLIMCLSFQCVAEKPHGFLWYNIPRDIKSPGIPYSQLSHTERDKVLHFYTMEALHKARQTKKLEDVHTFLVLQDYWIKEAAHFARLFQKTLLYYPELDYSVTHPTSSIGAKWLDESRQMARQRKIHKLSKTHGLLFFYRGSHTLDQKQIPMLLDFSERFNLTLIPVSVDGINAPQLPDTRKDEGQAKILGIQYFPALLLVNPKTHQTIPVAYGLTTQDVLEKRLAGVL